jgi:hypothetical protein
MGSDPGHTPPVSLLEIGRVLEEASRLVRQHAGEPDEPAEQMEAATAAHVRTIIAFRSLRRRYLGFDPADAAWSMMLELYAAQLEGRSLSQTRLGTAAGVPQTTALQVIRRLLDAGIFTKEADPDDKRILVIGLSGPAADRMRAYLVATHGLAGLAI